MSIILLTSFGDTGRFIPCLLSGKLIMNGIFCKNVNEMWYHLAKASWIVNNPACCHFRLRLLLRLSCSRLDQHSAATYRWPCVAPPKTEKLSIKFTERQHLENTFATLTLSYSIILNYNILYYILIRRIKCKSLKAQTKKNTYIFVSYSLLCVILVTP